MKPHLLQWVYRHSHLSIYLSTVSVCPPPTHTQTHIHTGISFVLNGETYTLNDIVTITDIGEGPTSGLRATTTHRPCCSAGQIGQWFLPGVTNTLSFSDTANISRSRSDNGEIILNRRNNATSPTGIYTCSIPDSNGVLTDVYIGIYLEATGQKSFI